MKCKDIEQNVYLYSELSEAERMQVDAHIEECTACKELFQLVSTTQALVSKTAATKPELANHARMTSTIMQAIGEQKKESASWINSLFIKYAMVAASLALVIAFSVEQLSPVENLSKTMPGAKTVTLNSASFIKAALDRKENPEPAKPSLYACVKSGGCDNTFIGNSKKNSF